jgi:hypothetical protein
MPASPPVGRAQRLLPKIRVIPNCLASESEKEVVLYLFFFSTRIRRNLLKFAARESCSG